jgi:hypothetical protein
MNYDPTSGLKTSTTDPNGLTDSSVLNSFGQEVARVMSDGNVQPTEYYWSYNNTQLPFISLLFIKHKIHLLTVIRQYHLLHNTIRRLFLSVGSSCGRSMTHCSGQFIPQQLVSMEHGFMPQWRFSKPMFSNEIYNLLIIFSTIPSDKLLLIQIRIMRVNHLYGQLLHMTCSPDLLLLPSQMVALLNIITQVWDLIPNKKIYNYAFSGISNTIIDANNHSTTRYFDLQHNTLKEVDSTGNVTLYSYLIVVIVFVNGNLTV